MQIYEVFSKSEKKVSIWSKILNSKSVFSAIFAWTLDPPPRPKRKTSPKTVTATVRKTTLAQWSWPMIVGLQASNCQIPRKTRSLGQLQLCPNYAAKSALPMLELVLKSCWTWPTPIQSMRISHPLGNVQNLILKLEMTMYENPLLGQAPSESENSSEWH